MKIQQKTKKTMHFHDFCVFRDFSSTKNHENIFRRNFSIWKNAVSRHLLTYSGTVLHLLIVQTGLIGWHKSWKNEFSWIYIGNPSMTEWTLSAEGMSFYSATDCSASDCSTVAETLKMCAQRITSLRLHGASWCCCAPPRYRKCFRGCAGPLILTINNY